MANTEAARYILKRVGIKKFTGLLLIVLAIFLLVLWEAKGREIIMMDEVLAAKKNIASMETIDKSMFEVISVPVNAKIEGAFTKDDAKLLNNMVTLTPIPRGGQISLIHIRDKSDKEKNEDSFFVLEKEWISMRSSALRRGDIIEIISTDNEINFGKYKIAFVKNEEDAEVADLSDLGISNKERSERINATSEIHHIEIVASVEEYMNIKLYIENNSAPSLILVQRER